MDLPNYCGINYFPKPLSKEDQIKTSIEAVNGDSSAKQKLITHNLRLVSYIAYKKFSIFNNPLVEYDDLINIGTIGLIKAVNSFNINKGTLFTTYATKCINNEILMYFRSLKNKNYISIENINIKDSETYYEGPETDYLTKETYKIVKSSLSELDDLEKKIIYLRYGFIGDVICQREISKIINCSQSYVSQIERRALKKISKYLKSADFDIKTKKYNYQNNKDTGLINNKPNQNYI